jgi:chromosome segregation ATPase
MFTLNRFAVAAAFAAAAVLFLSSARTEAQPSTRALTERGYERIRSLSDDLDRTARQAAEAAQNSRSGPYSDRELQRVVSNFARRAHAFEARVANYRVRPWQMDDELAGLLADAKSVQSRIQESRRRDQQVLEDWSRTAGLLSQMTDVYREDLGRGGNRRTEGPAYRDDRGSPGGRSSVAALVSDVSERVNRLAERARQLSGPIPADERQRNAWQAIQKLAQDASALGVRIDREGQPRDLRSAVARLNTEAAEADRLMRAGNVFPEIKAQWADLMQAVARLRQSTGA